jgi:hypothetical protein
MAHDRGLALGRLEAGEMTVARAATAAPIAEIDLAVQV